MIIIINNNHSNTITTTTSTTATITTNNNNTFLFSLTEWLLYSAFHLPTHDYLSLCPFLDWLLSASAENPVFKLNKC